MVCVIRKNQTTLRNESIGRLMCVPCKCAPGCTWGFWLLALSFRESVVFISKEQSFALRCFYKHFAPTDAFPNISEWKLPQICKRQENSVSSEDGEVYILLCTVRAGVLLQPQSAGPCSLWREIDVQGRQNWDIHEELPFCLCPCTASHPKH